MTQIDELRAWRKQAMEAYLYDTAELVGDKILALSGHPDDAYWLAQTYYGMGEYIRGAALILDNLYEQESPKCRYVAGLCLLQAQNLDAALALLTADYSLKEFPSSNVSSQRGSYPGSRAVSGPTSTPTAFHVPSSASSSTATPGNSGGMPNAGASKASATIVPVPATAPKPHNKVRVLSTSSLKAPGAQGSRTISGSSRVSMILPGFDEDLPDFPISEEPEELNGVFVDALMQFLLGRVYTMQSKFGLAKEAYIAALRLDARCFDAFAQLVKYHALTPKEEQALLDSLDFSRAGTDFGHSLYSLRLTAVNSTANKFASGRANLIESYMIPDQNSDLATADANQVFAEGRVQAAKKAYEVALSEDKYNLRIYTNYAACLLELNDANQLYKVAHELAETSPDSAVTWYSVGLYYMATKRIPEARVQFSRASLIDPGYAPAWLAFARTFAEECEHEQAITAFSTVARLFPGYHLPYVCIGIQHLQLFNLTLAEKYLATAADFFEEDPLIMNELGVVFYHQNKLQRALQVLEFAAQLVDVYHSCDRMRVSILSNMAYVLRRMGRPSAAYTTFEKVCAITALDPTVLSAMGLCLLQMGDTNLACEKLALALALSPDDPVTNDLMKRAVQMASQDFNIDEFVANNQQHIHKQRIEVAFTEDDV